MMKDVMFLCLAFIALVLVAYSEVEYNDEKQFFRMKHREVEDDDQSTNSQGDISEELELIRRQSSQCEPCGALRRPCCFPDLCQHRRLKISTCYKV